MQSASFLRTTGQVREIVFRYRATLLSNGQSPAEVYLGRRLRIQLDVMFPPSESNTIPTSPNVRKLHEGERVQAHWYVNNKLTWRFGTVGKRLGKLHYIIKLDSGYVLKRHIDQLQSTLVPPSRTETGNASTKISTTAPIKSLEKSQPDLSEFDLLFPRQGSNVPETVVQNEPEPEQELRRSTRERQPPIRYRDYIQ